MGAGVDGRVSHLSLSADVARMPLMHSCGYGSGLESGVGPMG